MISLNSSNKLPIKNIMFYILAEIIPLSFLAILLLGKRGFFFSLLFIIFIILPGCILIYLKFKFINFIVEDDKITINSGIIFKRSKSIPFDKIQNVENIKGILLRLFGISKVNIWTSSPEQIQVYKKETIYKPAGSLMLTVADGEWLNNFILSKHS